MAKGLGASRGDGGARSAPAAAHPNDADDALDARDEVSRIGTRIEVDAGGTTERIGRYRVTGVLGRGGMGVVYEVVDDASGARLALKTIETRFLELSQNNAELRFKQEIAVLERLDHPSIIKMFDSGFALHPRGQELAFYVMERLQGTTLDAELKAGRRFSAEEALGIVGPLTGALAYLAKHGVLHRDIKPANVFRELSGRTVLMDFGLARSEELTRLTIAGQVVGTFGYMSPERLTGKKLEVASDVYALGVVLFQMLTGHHPFPAQGATAMLEAIRKGVTVPEHLRALHHGDELAALLESMLAYAPSARPQPAALEDRIDDLLGRLEESSPTRRKTTVRASKPADAAVRAAPALDVDAAPNTAAGTSAPGMQSMQSMAFAPPRPAGPTWGTTGLLTMSAAAVAFLAGLLVGRMPAAPTPAPTRPTIVTPSDGTPAISPRARGTPVVEVAAPSPESFTSATDAYEAGARLIGAGQPGDAIALLNRALALNPAYADAHRLLGDAYAATSNPDRAATHYKTFLALRPNADEAPAVKRALDALPR
ncbi:protein kinase [Myxococcota bacterium]|nr:protein kinase [Myxococcota bacterium]